MISTRKLVRTITCTALTLASAVPSCSGRVADLGNSGPGSGPVLAGSPTSMQGVAGAAAATTPSKLVDREFQVTAFTVDAGQIFWMATASAQLSAQPPSPSPAGYLRTCAVANCVGSVMSWPLQNPAGIRDLSTKIHTSVGSVFFPSVGVGEGLKVCPKGDCSAPRSLLAGVDVRDFAVANQTLFVLSVPPDTVLSCSESDCNGTLIRFAMRAPDGEAPFSSPKRIVADDTFLYMLLDDGRVIRTRQDGAGTFEVIARGQINASDLAQQGDSIFWTESVVLGHIFRCPKTGCAASPDVVAAGLHKPTSLALDSSSVYFSEPADITSTSDPEGIPGSNRTSRCALPTCSVPTVLLEKVGYPGFVVVDDRFIYFSGYHCNSGVSDGSQPCGFVVTLPK